MNNDAMNAGVAPGGLVSKTEIKILICYLLKVFDKPLPLGKVKELLHFAGIANYFELAVAISDLEESKSIAFTDESEGEKQYVLSQNGYDIVKELGNDLPLSVREKAYDIVFKYLTRKRIERENSVNIEKNDNGYYITCTINEQSSELLSVKLLVPDEATALTIKERFLDNPMELLIEATEKLIGTKL